MQIGEGACVDKRDVVEAARSLVQSLAEDYETKNKRNVISKLLFTAIFMHMACYRYYSPTSHGPRSSLGPDDATDP
jgi:hypothetical protein